MYLEPTYEELAEFYVKYEWGGVNPGYHRRRFYLQYSPSSDMSELIREYNLAVKLGRYKPQNINNATSNTLWYNGIVTGNRAGTKTTRSDYCFWYTRDYFVHCSDNGKDYQLHFQSKFQNGGRRAPIGTSPYITCGGYYMRALEELIEGRHILFQVSDPNQYFQDCCKYADNYTPGYRNGEEIILLRYKLK